jgi:hypothetical protein
MADDSKVQAPLDGGDFRGTSRSFTVLRGGAGWETCPDCNSTLVPSRLEYRNRRRVIAGRELSVDKFRCLCGRGREIRRPLEQAA